MKVTLKTPVKRKDAGVESEITSITLPDKFKAKHIKYFPQAFLSGNVRDVKPADIVPMVVGISGFPESIIDEIDLSDLMEIMEAVNSIFFVPDSPVESTKEI